MADGTHIEWTDATWNPITGCSVVSPGCTNCYAMKLAGTRLKHSPSREGLTTQTKAGPVWTGEVRYNEQWRHQPLQWSRPRRIFVCAHGDLFHEAVPDGWIARVWNVMGLCPQHQFQILTKRPARMRDWVSRWADLAGEDVEDPKLVFGPEETRRAHPSGRGQLFAAMLEAMGSPPAGASYPTFDWMHGQLWWPAVLPNVWLGVSVEDQPRADDRIPHLRATPAAVRFLCCEPLLGPIDLDYDLRRDLMLGRNLARPISWVIAGGESGPNARPMHPEWARSLRDQCARAAVPFFFKQWGEFGPEGLSSQAWICRPDGSMSPDPVPNGIGRHHQSGYSFIYRVGKKTAGATLDGREHKAFPDA